jgi:hypothetical protein
MPAPDEHSRTAAKLRALCRLAGRSQNKDNRANALQLVAVCDACWRSSQSLDLLYALVGFEPDDSIIETAASWLPDTACRMEQRHVAAASMAMLRAPSAFRFEAKLDAKLREALLPKIDEAVRAVVLLSNYDFQFGDELSLLERLSLLRQQLEFVLSLPLKKRYAKDLGFPPLFFGVTAVEMIIRELMSILKFRPGAPEPELDEWRPEGQLVAEALLILRRCVEDRQAIIYMAKYVMDFILLPLAYFMKMPEFAEEARSLAINVIAIMSETELAHEIPMYNQLIHDVTEGGGLSMSLFVELCESCRPD